MKKLILTILVLASANALAFGVNLSEEGQLSVDELVQMQATSVSCDSKFPKCLLVGTKYGIQYEGQSFSDVELTDEHYFQGAARHVKILKNEGLCN
jgi:hypothetical protein